MRSHHLCDLSCRRCTSTVTEQCGLKSDKYSGWDRPVFKSVAVGRYGEASETTLIFSVRLTPLAEALQWNVNGVDRIFLVSFRFSKELCVLFRSRSDNRHRRHLEPTTYHKLQTPRGITAHQVAVGWPCPPLKQKEISCWKTRFDLSPPPQLQKRYFFWVQG